MSAEHTTTTVDFSPLFTAIETTHLGVIQSQLISLFQDNSVPEEEIQRAAIDKVNSLPEQERYAAADKLWRATFYACMVTGGYEGLQQEALKITLDSIEYLPEEEQLQAARRTSGAIKGNGDLKQQAEELVARLSPTPPQQPATALADGPPPPGM